MRGRPASLWRSLPLVWVAVACGKDAPAPAERPRPVTVFRLAPTSPQRLLTLTGSVDPYREEQVGFDVGGRVEYVRDIGIEVDIDLKPDPGNDEAKDSDPEPGEFRPAPGIVGKGEIIARLDDTRYRLAERSLAAQKASIEARIAAQEIDLKSVATADVAAAEAQKAAAESDVGAAKAAVESAESAKANAERTFNREKQLSDSGAGTRDALDQARTALEQAQASLTQAQEAVHAKESARDAASAALARAQANVKLKEANLQSTRADLQQIVQRLQTARQDLEDCTLRAPFAGRITEVFVNRGGYVGPGQPVVMLTLMDPIRVTVAVSADQDRLLRAGDQAWVRLKNPIKPGGDALKLLGTIFEKGAVADAATRTFRIHMMVRNQRIYPTGRRADAPVVGEGLIPSVARYHNEPGPIYVSTRCLLEVDGKTYVLRVPGLRFGKLSTAPRGFFEPEAIEVELGDDYFQTIHWVFRSVRSSKGLELGDVLLGRPKREYLKGVVVGRPEWALRPRELVPVTLDLGVGTRGYYVPVESVVWKNGRTFVYVVDVGDVARRVEVKAHDPFHGLRRIEPLAPGLLADGARCVLRGVHYLEDGMNVAVTAEKKVSR